MTKFKKYLMRFLGALVVLYIASCAGLYFFQEKLIFHPKPLKSTEIVKTEYSNVSYDVQTKDNQTINLLHIKSKHISKGLIFYLHGNVGNVKSWSGIEKYYLPLGYDLCILDYRGYGRSRGEIESEEQFFDDIQRAFNLMKEKFGEGRITILGYSVGTFAAIKLAAFNNPKQLILFAPFYNFTDMMAQRYPMFPSFLLRYPFNSNEYLPKVKAPVTIFHAIEDKAIYFASSLKLKKLFKKTDRLFPLKNQGHGGMDENLEIRQEIKKLLP